MGFGRSEWTAYLETAAEHNPYFQPRYDTFVTHQSNHEQTWKEDKMFSKLLSTTALAAIALTATSCSNQAPSNQSQVLQQGQQATPKSVGTATSAPMAKANRAELVQEAVEALRETSNALTAIDRNKTNDAIAALERATGKLEIVLARTPELALAPVDVTATTYDVLGSVGDVERIRDAAKSAIDRGRLQDARRLISDLASETVVSTSSLPLATYPTALKQSAALLHQGKAQDAKAVLETALGTIVIEHRIAPLPLARAQVAIDQAKGLSEKANRTEAESARLRSLLATARTQLRFGQALGYATEKDMKNLMDAVDEIERNTSGQRHGKGLLDRIGGLFVTARQASQPQQSKR